MKTTVVWFRQDLRLADNPALSAAAARGAVVPVYVVDDEALQPWAPGGAGRWWRAESLRDLDRTLVERGSGLWLLAGPALEALTAVIEATDADAVMWNRCYEPQAIERDRALMATLKARGVNVSSYSGSLLFEPWKIKTLSKDYYKVFTPFARACRAFTPPRTPVSAPQKLHSPKVLSTAHGLSIDAVVERETWTAGLAKAWQPGWSFGLKTLHAFLEDKVEDYGDSRDVPAIAGTSLLSPRLHWGELSPNQIWYQTIAQVGGDGAMDPGTGGEAFLRELLWREFGYHILFHAPHLPHAPLREPFAAFPWADRRDHRNAWRFGRTGFPIVDAGMRQLRETGWMHNRVRMVVGSFLVKDLLEDWQHGAAWFWDNLVDADLASNTLGWQWVGGCGPDAAPYFRIFNPVRQGEKFDPDGAYVRRWVPELARLPATHVHAPWMASDDVLAAAGVNLGETYPRPIVDHKQARQRALDALATIKQSA